MSTGSQHQNPENEMFTDLDGIQDFLAGREEIDRINLELIKMRKRTLGRNGRARIGLAGEEDNKPLGRRINSRSNSACPGERRGRLR